MHSQQPWNLETRCNKLNQNCLNFQNVLNLSKALLFEFVKLFKYIIIFSYLLDSRNRTIRLPKCIFYAFHIIETIKFTALPCGNHQHKRVRKQDRSFVNANFDCLHFALFICYKRVRVSSTNRCKNGHQTVVWKGFELTL